MLIEMGFDVVQCLCGGTAIQRGRSAAVASALTIGRMIVEGKPIDEDRPRTCERMLLEVLSRRWPENTRVKFLITPGGVLTSSAWPSRWSGHKGWESRASDWSAFTGAAQAVLSRVVTRRVLAAASGKVEVFTIGLDILGPEGQHVELIAVVEIGSGNVQCTGKSYPKSTQEARLVQVVDLGTHLLPLAGERVLVLGCHDLNMFSPRGRAAQDSHGPGAKFAIQ